MPRTIPVSAEARGICLVRNTAMSVGIAPVSKSSLEIPSVRQSTPIIDIPNIPLIRIDDPFGWLRSRSKIMITATSFHVWEEFTIFIERSLFSRLIMYPARPKDSLPRVRINYKAKL